MYFIIVLYQTIVKKFQGYSDTISHAITYLISASVILLSLNNKAIIMPVSLAKNHIKSDHFGISYPFQVSFWGKNVNPSHIMTLFLHICSFFVTQTFQENNVLYRFSPLFLSICVIIDTRTQLYGSFLIHIRHSSVFFAWNTA